MEYSEDARNFYFNEQNKKKKKEIEEKFDGKFYKSDDSKLTPDIENQFLDNILEFEKQFENAKYIKLINFIGNPVFKNIDELSESNLPAEIDKVLGIYNENGVNVDILEKEDVSDKDFYIFLTEELPKHETDNLKLPGWTINFIYEEFHPSDKLDAKNAVEDVLLDAVFQNREDGPTYIAKNNLFNPEGKPISKNEFLRGLYSIFDGVGEIIEREFFFNDFQFGNENSVNVDFILRYKNKNYSEEIDKVFNFTFWLCHSEYGGMEVIRYKLNC